MGSPLQEAILHARADRAATPRNARHAEYLAYARQVNEERLHGALRAFAADVRARIRSLDAQTLLITAALELARPHLEGVPHDL